MRDAIAIWQDADRTIDALKQLSEQFRQALHLPNPDPQRTISLRAELQRLNNELLQLENRFSLVLSEGARWVKQTVWRIAVLALIVFIGLGLLVSRQIIKSITASERELTISESRFRSLKKSNTIGIISWRMDGTKRLVLFAHYRIFVPNSDKLVQMIKKQ